DRQSAWPYYSVGTAYVCRRGHRMNRRELIALIGGAVAWPLAARAQKSDQLRRIGVVMSTAADDTRGQAWHAAFVQGLQQLGWEVGRNVQIDTRWGEFSLSAKLLELLKEIAPGVK